MKFRLLEYWEDEEQKVTQSDLNLLDSEVIERWLRETKTIEQAREFWVNELYPLLSDEDKKEIDKDFGTVVRCMFEMDYYDIANDAERVKYFNQDDLDDMIQEYFQDEIEEYLDSPSIEEIHNEWEQDYRRSVL